MGGEGVQEILVSFDPPPHNTLHFDGRVVLGKEESISLARGNHQKERRDARGGGVALLNQLSNHVPEVDLAQDLGLFFVCECWWETD